MRSKFLLAAAVLLTASPAAAAVTVIGSSGARDCFLAAESHSLVTRSMILTCDDALNEEGLTHYDMVATYVNRGILKARMGQLDEAIADYDAALARDPNEPEAYLNKGYALLHLPDAADRAKPMFDSAIEKKTRRPELAYYGRGVANEMAGEVRAAYYDYRQASMIDPKWRDPKVELARFKVE